VPVLWAEVVPAGGIELSEEEAPVLQLLVFHPFMVGFKAPSLISLKSVSRTPFVRSSGLAYCSGSIERVVIMVPFLFHVEEGPGSGALGFE
jgi:hypothetical protein